MNGSIHTKRWSDLQNWLWHDAAAWLFAQNTGVTPLATGEDCAELLAGLYARWKERAESIESAIHDWADTGVWPALDEEQAMLASMMIEWAGHQFDVLGHLEDRGWIGGPPAETDLRWLVVSLVSGANRGAWLTGAERILSDVMEGFPLRLHGIEAIQARANARESTSDFQSKLL